jgi:nucleotide-binding universal stress UspA family protein
MAVVCPILLALDGSAWAEAALPHAAALAARLGARLLLVRPSWVGVPPGPGAAGQRKRARTQGRVYLRHAAGRVRQAFPCLDLGVALPAGRAPEAILDEAALVDAGLIVVATHGRDDATRWGLGRVAEGVASRAAMPVLLVRPPAGTPDGDAPDGDALPAVHRRHRLPGRAPPDHGAADGPEPASWPLDVPWLRQRVRVLVPLDGTPAAEGALPFLVRLGACLPLSVTLLHVVRPPASGNGVGEEGQDTACGAMDALLDETPGLQAPTLGGGPSGGGRLCWATAAGYCRRAAAWMGAHGVAARVELRAGDAAEEIGRSALDRADVLVLGTPAGRRVSRWGCGSAVDRLLRRSRWPVLLVPSRRAAPVVPAVPARWRMPETLDYSPMGAPAEPAAMAPQSALSRPGVCLVAPPARRGRAG